MNKKEQQKINPMTKKLAATTISLIVFSLALTLSFTSIYAHSETPTEELPVTEQQISNFPEISILPDNPLYPLKMLSEWVVSLFTFGKENKVKRQIYLAEKRLVEAEALMEKKEDSKYIEKTFERYKKRIDRFISYKNKQKYLSIESRDAFSKRLLTHENTLLKIYGYMQTVGLHQKVAEKESEQDRVSGTSRHPLPIELKSRTVVFEDGTEANFSLASEFDLNIAAENIGKARFIAISSDERMFVPDMIDWNLNREGRIIILEDFDDETHRFKSRSIYLSGLRGPNGVAFYTDRDGNEWIYIALTEKLIRYPYRAGDMVPSSEAEIIVHFPNQQSSGAKGIVWHITRTIIFHDDVLYVSIGSGCNSCEQKEGEMRAMIISLDPDGKNVKVYAEGLRNAVGIVWAEDSLYATVNGVDHLGDNTPDDIMYKVIKGENYGWPYCYPSGGINRKDIARQWKRVPIDCEDVPLTFTSFEPHSAPLGLAYFENAHPLLSNTFLVALRGSHKVSIGNGYSITRVEEDGTQEIFMEGFLGEEGERLGRPVHILQNDKNSFFFTDDFKGRLYYVHAE